MANRTAELTDREYRRLARFRSELRRYLRWSEEVAAGEGLTPAQHQLLLAIRAWPEGDPTIGDLAEELLLRHHSAVGLVDRAADGGLVARVSDPDDHRVVRVRLTPRGRAQLTRLAGRHLQELPRLARAVRDLAPAPRRPAAAAR